jgi:hypothetical protein
LKNANAKPNLSGDTGGQAVRQFPVMALLTSVRRTFKFSLSGCRRQPVGINNICLKGPKREIFGLGIFAQIRPIWIGDLGIRPKNPKKLGLWP